MNLIKKSVIHKIADQSDPIFIDGRDIQPGYIFFSEENPSTIYIGYVGTKGDVRKRIVSSYVTKFIGRGSPIPSKKQFRLVEATFPTAFLSTLKKKGKFIITDKSHWNFLYSYPVYKVLKTSTTALWLVEILNSFKEDNTLQISKTKYINPV